MKVITTVGTSLITNYKDEEIHKFLEKQKVKNTLIDTDAYKYSSKNEGTDDDINDIKELIINNWITNIEQYEDDGDKKYRQGDGLNEHCCAEVQTLVNMIKDDKYKDKDLEVYLLATDTQLSQLAAKIIEKEIFNKVSSLHPNIKVVSNQKVDDLNVTDATTFEEKGFFNLIEKVKKIKGNDDVVLNISGGYKALIPPLTIVAQLYDIDLVYMYEDSDKIVNLSRLPLQFDLSLLEPYTYYLRKELIEFRHINNQERPAFKELVELNLFKENNHQRVYQRTIIGKFLNTYIENEYPLSDNVLGFYMEHKFYELYIEENYSNSFSQVLHSVKVNRPEIDLVLRNNQNEFIACEVKSFNQINFAFNTSNGKCFSQQFQYQIDRAFLNGNDAPTEYHLLIYKHSFQRNSWLNDSLSQLKAMISPICDFKVFIVEIDFRLKSRDYFKNPYQQFMSRKFTRNSIKYQNGIDNTKQNKRDFELVKELRIN